MPPTLFTLLDLRRAKKDKTYPIVFKLIHKGTPTTLNSGYSVLTSNWNTKSCTVKTDCENIPSADKFNKLLKKREIEIRDALMNLYYSGEIENLSITEIKSLLVNKGKKGKFTFIEYANTVIQSIKEEGRTGTAGAYTDAINFLKNSTKNNNLPFSMLNVKLLNKLEHIHMSVENNHYNGLSVYLRSIRTIYNRAIADGIVSLKSYPFRRGPHDRDKYQIKSEKTKKRAINKESILAIEKLAFSLETGVFKKHLYYFLFSFYLRGMNLADIAKLKRSSINNNHVEYIRSKSKRTYEIKIGEKARSILVYFDYQKKKPSNFVFPILTRKTPEGIKMDIKNCIKQTNKYLKKASESLKLDVKITTYVSRHSWATIADKAGVDRRIISKGLGHADLKTTDIYIDDIVSTDDLAAADDLITG